MLKFNSIKTKLILFNLFLIVLSVAVFIGIIININRENLSVVRKNSKTLMEASLQAEWETKLRAMTVLLSNRLIQPMYNFDIFEIRYLIMTTIEKDISYIYVHDKEGRLLAADVKGSETRGAELMGKVLDDELTKKAIAIRDILVQKQGDVIDIASPIVLGQKKLAVVRIGFSTRGIQNTIAEMTKELEGGLNKAAITAINYTILAGTVVGIPIIVVVLIFTKRLLSPVYALIDGTRRVAAGDLTYRIKAKSKDEIGQLSESFNKMTEEIAKYHAERDKVLKDIHDGIGGITTNIKLLSELAQSRSSIKETKNTLKTISELAKEGLSEIRGLIYSMDVKETSWQDLVAELRGFGSSMIEPHNMSFNMKSSVEDVREQVSSLLYLNIFRTFKEALTNIVKHSKAKSVEAALSVNTANITLTIKDDGIGFKEDEKGRGRGISNMTVRAKELGGQLTIISDNGACVALEIPIPIKYPDKGMEK
jgi:signal transduction histidine kinase